MTGNRSGTVVKEALTNFGINNGWVVGYQSDTWTEVDDYTIWEKVEGTLTITG